MGGLSHMFKPEFWNYAKLISGVLRHEMPIQDVVNLVTSLKLDSESINNWKNGVERALKKYIPNGTKAKGKCGECGSDNLVYEEGCLICKDCGSSKCGYILNMGFQVLGIIINQRGAFRSALFYKTIEQ
jgi:ribonucleoside-diphosphate reductase alpha chain